MSFGNIKIDAADKTFSIYVRLRDKCCVSCKRIGERDMDGRAIVGLQASHYWSRRHESTRFDPENVDALCIYCHQQWGGDYRDQYKAFKVKQLGKKGYDLLELRHNQYQKRDRKLALIVAKALLKEIGGKS